MTEQPDKGPEGGQYSLPVSECLPIVEQYGRDHADVYAGAFLGDGVVNVGFVGDAKRHVMAIQGHVSRPEVIRFFSARRTQQELIALRDRVTQDRTLLAEQGIGLASAGLDTRANRVTIVLERLSPQIEAALRHRYGDGIAVQGSGVYRAL